MKLVPDNCALEGFKIRCVGDLQGHHIINKAKARGNPEVRKIFAECPDEIMAKVCYSHHQGGIAESSNARRIMLLQKIYKYGFGHISDFINDLPWKIQHYELTLEAMLEIKRSTLVSGNL